VQESTGKRFHMARPLNPGTIDKTPHAILKRPEPKPAPIDWARFDPPKRRDEDDLRAAFGLPTDY
jgi:hypothetical protein